MTESAMNSAIYEGQVRHRRFSPATHAFAYRLFMVYLDLSELAKALLTQDLSELENMIRQAAEQSGTDRIENMLQVGFFSRRTTEQLGLEGAQQDLEALAEQMRAQGMGEEAIQQMQEMIRSGPFAVMKDVAKQNMEAWQAMQKAFLETKTKKDDD